MPRKPLTTTTLVRQAQGGDREALEALFARSYPDLLQAARFRLGPELRARMDTLDLAQAAYLEAYRDLATYRYRGKGSFRRWLLGIVEHKVRSCLDFYRAKRRDLRREVPLGGRRPVESPVTSPTRKILAHEDRKRLEAAMDELDGPYREVIVCRYYLRMPWREIGEHLGRSEEAAQMLCRRALARLKEIYTGSGGKGGD